MGTTLVLAHGLWYGGGQVSTLEFLKLLQNHLDRIHVVVGTNANPEFVRDIRALRVTVSTVPCRRVASYPDLAVEKIPDLIRQADVVWISDMEYIAAPKIKRIKDVPVTAHLREYSLVCHRMGVSCGGLRETCLQPCNARHIIKCKRLINEELSNMEIISHQRSEIYKILDFGKGPLDFARWRFRKRNVIESIDGFISVSKATLEIHEKHIPKIGEKAREVVHNPPGVPASILKGSLYGTSKQKGQGPNGLPILTYIHHSAQLHKGPHIFVQALNILKSRGLKVEANMVGCRDTWVERYANKLGVNNIKFTHRLPRNDIYHLMNDSSLVVVPSLWPEPFGRVALEANYLGVPVVASNIGGLPEVIDEKRTGFLADPHSPRDFAEKIEESMNAGFQRQRIHELTKEKFNPEVLARKLGSFLRQFLS